MRYVFWALLFLTCGTAQADEFGKPLTEPRSSSIIREVTRDMVRHCELLIYLESELFECRRQATNLYGIIVLINQEIIYADIMKSIKRWDENIEARIASVNNITRFNEQVVAFSKRFPFVYEQRTAGKGRPI